MAKPSRGNSMPEMEAKLNTNTKFDKESDLRLNEEMEKRKEIAKARFEEHIKAQQTSTREMYSSSSSSAEDEDGVEWTPEVEKKFFHTLACLKKDDTTVYDKNHKFFGERDQAALERAKADKALTVRDFELQRLIQAGADSDDEKSDADQPRGPPLKNQERKELLASFRTALDSDSDEEGLLAPRKPKSEEVVYEKGSYAAWLQGKGERLEDEKEETVLKPLKEFWTDPKLAEDEKFLKDYILTKPYKAVQDDLVGKILRLSDDEKDPDKQNDAEKGFNFRFEEPDGGVIKSFPRTMDNSVRKKDNRRKERRAAAKLRREEKYEAKVQELVKMKALKRKEIQNRIEALKAATGNDSLAFQDLDDDFDLAKHERGMQLLYDNPYYEGNPGNEKPEFSDLDDGSVIYPSDNDDHADGQQLASRSNGMGDNEFHCEDEDFNMDADYDPATAPAKSKNKNKGKQPEMWAILSKPRPIFDPAKQSFDAYIDEYYKMDFEDIIEDLPCRYKYRQVVPNDFGLTIEEILLADDKELNKWAPLNTAISVRTEYEERMDQKRYRNCGMNEQYKRKILPSLFKTNDEEEEPLEQQLGDDNDGAGKKRKKAGGKKKRRGEGQERTDAAGKEEVDTKAAKSSRSENEYDNGAEYGEIKKEKRRNHHDDGFHGEEGIEYPGVDDEFVFQNGETKKKKKRNHSENDLDAGEGMEDGRFDENTESKKKKKSKHSQNDLNAEERIEHAVVDEECVLENGESKKKKKKRKHSENELNTEEGIEEAGGDEEFVIQSGETKKKKKKKRKHRENDLDVGEGMEHGGVDDEIKLQNTESKKKKISRHSENDLNTEERIEHAVVDQESVLENGESNKKKKKKSRQSEKELNTEERIEHAVVDQESVTENGGTKKKKKKRKHSENDLNTGEGIEEAGVDEEFTLRNGETKKKKKKRKHSENCSDTEKETENVKKRKCEAEGEGDDGVKSAMSRRKRKNLKLLKLRELGKVQAPQKKKKRKPRFRERDAEARKRKLLASAAAAAPASGAASAPAPAPVKPVQDLITEERLEAYGVPKPKRYRNFLKYIGNKEEKEAQSQGRSDDTAKKHVNVK